MVVCTPDHGIQADVVFLIEATAVNGAYIEDITFKYIIPTIEYFNQGSIDENSYISENSNSSYGIVTYQAADCLPRLSSDTFGPFSSPSKVISAIERLELIGGKGESHANIAEGLATALCCFEELQLKRDPNIVTQKHCILICNSPPYLLPVFECQQYAGKNAEQLASILQEKNVNLSIISPRKIPPLYKLFEKSGGDLIASQTKNYARDPRHLVLLKGFSLKERPVSPPPGTVTNQPQLSSNPLPITSMPSPLTGNDSPIHNSQIGTPQNPNMMGNNSPTVGQSPVYRSPNPQVGRIMQTTQMAPMGMAGMPAPPGYHAATGNRPTWPMPPPTQQPRPYMPQNQPVNTTSGGSALIAQLNQPPSISASNVNVNQFGQINVNANSPINKMNMGQQPNVQTSMAQNPSINSPMPQVSQPNPVVTSQAQNTQAAPPQSSRERHTIWQGVLEWIEKPKNPTDQQKVTRHVPCQVSSSSKDGEPEMKADGWPQKLIMQLMPKQLIGNIGGSYLKNSKSVLFHPTHCEALESLTRVMNSGFAGCVHFTNTQNPPSCDIKVLILLYTADKRAYLGFIPNDQVAFVDRLRKVIQQQKSTQMRQGGNGQPMNPQGGGQLPMGNTQQMSGANPVTSQSGQGLMISQTNTMSMGGGQITQNVSGTGQPGAPLGQPGPGIGQTMGQTGIVQSGSAIGQGGSGIGQPGGNIGQPGNPIGQPGGPNIAGIMGQNVGQQGPNQGNMQGGMMGQPVQRAPFENQLQAERQQNLEKINKLKQTLEAAQQQEQQYKSQLERISHMKTSHLQEALQAAQHTEMQYKILEQRMSAQNNPQVPQPTNPQQQRMMRPVMTNNPGLRHLLQQQPQYRQQLISMQQMGGNNSRGQMGQQQMPNPQAGQPNQFDEVPGFDFNELNKF
ncbi:mediator of RNA polymerase II transcription subunit 25-like isoform X2 [Sitophilus oryzae]|uniref:Mediator of RNA polymerase II transcription subunit 25 n=1 Tax=Sitophilus oryzae TaxID=7048 RepID=A0A6J2XB33_SITOR|nr:mediator of RNA polymerase II transcription subunit 25-like isoform X2 [Sitophilus oryzae]